MPLPDPASDLQRREFSRILIVKPSSLGDVIHALPVLHGLRARYPNAVIDWLIGAPFGPILDGQTGLRDVLIFERGRYGRMLRDATAGRHFLGFLAELRRRHYDLVIDLQGLFRTGFLTWATGAPVRLGFGSARELAWLFYNRRIDTPDPDEHAVDRYWRVAVMLGFADEPIRFDLSVADGARDAVAALLREHGVRDEQPFLAVVPGARWETKRWPAESFAQLIAGLAPRVPCVLLGSSGEAALCDSIASFSRARPVNLAGRTGILEMCALIDRAAVTVCHDSAALHVAVALGRPAVCLTGPTNPRRTGPYRRMEDVVRLELDCSPCYLRRISQCPYDHRCMRELAVETVAAAVQERLAAAHRLMRPDAAPMPAAPR